MKKYCLLENGQIEPCYYENGEQRNFYKDNGKWYLLHGVFAHGMYLDFCHQVIKFADTIEELK